MSSVKRPAPMNANLARHLAIFGRGVRRLALTQPPHFRTGLLPATAPSYAERLACAVLGESRADLARHLARTGVHAPVPHLSPTKVQAKKIQRVLEHHAGNY